MYFADRGRIRTITPAGIITTVGGSLQPTTDQVGGPATATLLGQVWHLAFDGRGNLYFSDRTFVRKISPAGIITAFAGTVQPGFSGDGGPATAARLSFPRGIAVDAQGNVYIADANNHRVRKVNPAGIITTVAGSGQGVGFPRGFGDGGPATRARLALPAGLAFDKQGNLYIADAHDRRIRRVTPRGRISTFAGRTSPLGTWGDGGRATKALLGAPYGVAVDRQGNVYVGDTSGHRIRKIDRRGIIRTIAGSGANRIVRTDGGFSGDGGPSLRARLSFPHDVAVDAQGNVYIADSSNHRIRKVTNPPPIASFRATPESGPSPLRVSFDASASRDPNGTVVGYAWQFGDGGTGTGRVVTHTFARPGTFTVTLTVNDDSGGTGTATKTITVR